MINDKTKKVVSEERYEIENGFVDGHIFIDNLLPTGNYSLAAYTQHSFFKNQKDFYALKKITVFNNVKYKNKKPLFKNDTIAQFSLFPEGGHIVSNLNNKLAFKAVNKEGLPIPVSGTLFENDLPLLNFKSFYEGMGQFTFTPNNEKKNHIRLNQKKDTIYTLPKIKNTGKILSLVANNDSILKFKVSQSKQLSAEKVYLRLQMKGNIYAMVSAKLKENIIVNLSIKDLPQGILEVTLFNTNLQPIAERLVYIKLHEQLQITSSLYRHRFKTREKVVVRIKTTNAKNKPVPAHLGFSVFDKIYKDKRHSKNILSHYHLSTQLKGNIYNPSYYFNKENTEREKALDLLLLTQGWRRYVWQEENLKLKIAPLQPLVFNNIYGKIIFKSKKAKEQNLPMSLSAFNLKGYRSKKFIHVDSLQNFSVPSEYLKLGEKDYLLLRLYGLNQNKSKISLDDTALNKMNSFWEYANSYYPINQKKIKEEKEIKPFEVERAKVLDEVTVNTNVYDSFLKKLNNLLNTDFICGVNHLNCPFHLGKRDKKPIEGKVYSRVLFYKSGTWQESKREARGTRNKIIRLSPYKIPMFSEKKLFEKFNIVKVKGYYEKREFYKPIYDQTSIKDQFPDIRNTLYWKPDVITNQNGEATVEFYTSDVHRTFNGILEGVTQEGLLGKDSFEFKVKKRE